ncbi:AAA family ATPase [Rhodanobacter lindaniclasticus]
MVVQNLSLQTQGRQFRVVRREKGAFSIVMDEETQPRARGRHFAPERSIALSADGIAALDKDGPLVEDLSLAIRRELEGVNYLGPLRRKPERDYPWNKTKPGEVGSDGRAAIDALLASALLRSEDQNEIVEGVSKWLSRMKVAQRLEVRQQGRSSRYELVIHRDGVACNLRDVGIGVSQVLPVLVVAYFASPGSTILLEEPEIHLHPLAQSVLAELLKSAGREMSSSSSRRIRALFRRMQTLVARQKVSPDSVAMYFVERKRKSASLRELALDDYGRVSEWPDDFFGDALGETREQAKLMFERQKAAKA